MPELWKIEEASHTEPPATEPLGSQGPPGRLPCAQPQHQARHILDEPLAHRRGRYLHLMIPVSDPAVLRQGQDPVGPKTAQESEGYTFPRNRSCFQ